MSRITPPVPNTTLTPAYSTVSSPAGFQSGDLVYYKDSSFGTIPNNAVGIAPFNVTTTNAAIGGPFGRNAFVSVLNENINQGVSGRQRFAATLTNGNIVVVYGGGNPASSPGNGRPRFRIVDSNFQTVVADTEISATDTVWRSAIGVAALVGGGFVVVYTVTTGPSIRIAIFSNTGAVVTAIFIPAGWSSLGFIDVEPLPNGGFVVAGNQTVSGNQYRVATFNATGTQVNSNSPVISSYNSNDTPQIAVLTDGRFAVFTRSSAGVAIITGFNANCTTVGSGQTFAMVDPASGTGGALSVCSLSNNDVVVAITDGGISYVRKYFIDTNSWGSTEALNSGFPSFLPFITPLPGNNIGALIETAGGATTFQVLSSGFANLSITRYNGISMDTQNGNRLAVCATLVGSAVTFFMSTTNFGTSDSVSTPIQYFQFLSTGTYAPIYRRTSPTVVGTASSPVSGYARGNSTPNSAAFFASTSATLSISQPEFSGTSVVRAPTSIKSGVIYSDSCVLLDGRMVIAYATSSGIMGFMTINTAGTVTSDTSFASGGSGNMVIKCTALNNGGLILAFATGSNTTLISIRSYDAGLNLLVATTLNSATSFVPSETSVYVQGGFGLSSLGSSNFILVFTDNNSGGMRFAVFTSSVVVISSSEIVEPSRSPTVAGNIDGTFTVTWYNTSSGTGRLAKYAQTGQGTWSSTYLTSVGWPSTVSMATTSKMAPGGVGFHIFNGGSGNDALLRVAGNATGAVNTYNLGAASTCMSHAVAIGATGEVVILDIDPVFSQAMTVYSPGSAIVTTGPLLNNSITLTSVNSTLSSPGPCVICECLYDRLYAFAYISSDNSLLLGAFSTVNVTYSSSIVSGVTASTGALLPSPVNGYYLAGVSASECSAGGTGVLQINGAATLNSQYPAGTTSQAFDFNTPALDVGVRGTIAGRNMIISGGK